MQEYAVGRSIVHFCTETAGYCETEIGEEILRDTRLPQVCIVTDVQVGDGENLIAVLRDFLEGFKDYPVVCVASSEHEDKKKGLVLKMRSELAYNSLGFHSLANCYDDGATQYYVANNAASTELYELLQVKAFLIMFEEIMCDSVQTDRLINMQTGASYNGDMMENIRRWIGYWSFEEN